MKEKKNPIADFSGKNIDLISFNEKPEKEQKQILEDILKEIYGDNLKITNKYIMKVLSLTWNPKDEYIYLPYNLKVSKEKLELKFDVVAKRRIALGWLILLIWLFIFSVIGATYAGVKYVSIANLNKDTDGDGVADINIDLNDDDIADLNIDLDNDDLPDMNLDYRGNYKSVFNIDTDGDKKPDSNLVNDATNDKDHQCKINCDTDGDHFPEINIDLDGDGIPDINIDTDSNGIPDLNIDVTGNGKCDIMCDTDGDNMCNQNCIGIPEGLIDENGEVRVGENGNSQATASSPMLVIQYENGEVISVNDIYPDDQPGLDISTYINPSKSFTMENLSNIPLYYNLKWRIQTNTFITSNFQFKVESSNGGFTSGYETVPRTNDYISTKIMIPARTTQKYKITFRLHGTGIEQNIDQGKSFKAYVEIET